MLLHILMGLELNSGIIEQHAKEILLHQQQN